MNGSPTTPDDAPEASPRGRVRVFVGCSVDGFIAGTAGELDWLDGFAGAEDTFGPFLAEVGAILMGRRTYDAVCGFSGPWPYGDVPLLVATGRPLLAPRVSVRAVAGAVGELVAEARRIAGPRDVYLDGGVLVRSALDADLIDQLTITFVPVVLGHGVPLFAGLARRQSLTLVSHRTLGAGLVELCYDVVR